MDPGTNHDRRPQRLRSAKDAGDMTQVDSSNRNEPRPSGSGGNAARQTTPSRSRLVWLPASLIDHVGLLIVLAVLIIAFGLTTPYFLTTSTFTTIANQIPAIVLVSVGMTYVLIIGGIDLSVGSVLGLSSAVIGILMTAKHPALLIIAAPGALLVGLLCGAINGAITVTWPVPSFVVTLGMLEIARGATHLLTSSRTQ